MDRPKAKTGFRKLGPRARLGLYAFIPIALASIYFAVPSAVPRIDPSQITLGEVAHGTFVQDIRAPGVLVAKDVRWLNSQSDATVDKILLKPGAVVSEWTLIMRLSNPEVVDKSAQAALALRVGKAESEARSLALQDQLLDQQIAVAKVKADLDLAEYEASADKIAVEKGAISRLQQKKSESAAGLLRLRLDLEQQRLVHAGTTVRAQLGADQTRMEQLEGASALARKTQGALDLAAGIDGVLQSVMVQEGQRVPIGTLLAKVARPGALRAELQVAESRVRDVLVGQSVQIDIPGGDVKGRVTRIDPVVKNGSVLIEVEFDEPLPAGARADLNVEGRILVSVVQGVDYVSRPIGAMPDTTYVGFKVLPNSSAAIRTTLKFGRATSDSIEILSGASPGDRLIISDISQWTAYKSIVVN